MSILPYRVAICRLSPHLPIPPWATMGAFFSITRTRYELSVVTDERNLPEDVTADTGWRILKVRGPLDLDMTGVLTSVVEPLTEHEISIFSISTYDTDHILVPEERLEEAITALKKRGHEIIEAKELEEETR